MPQPQEQTQPLCPLPQAAHQRFPISLRRTPSHSSYCVTSVKMKDKVLPKSPAGKAVFYTLTRWEKLTRFMKHPVLELSTNWAENSMRPIAIGRKNWLHLGSKEAGPKIAAIFSVIESCRRLD